MYRPSSLPVTASHFRSFNPVSRQTTQRDLRRRGGGVTLSPNRRVRAMPAAESYAGGGDSSSGAGRNRFTGKPRISRSLKLVERAWVYVGGPAELRLKRGVGANSAFSESGTNYVVAYTTKLDL